MDIFVLHPLTFLPTDLVENLTSKIWTERYSSPGEFEFTSEDIFGTLALLPKRTLVSHRDTAHVMIVEDHILKDEDDIKTLTVKGRSYETFLTNRNIIGGKEAWPKKNAWKFLNDYNSVEAAAIVLWNHVVDNDPVITGVNENTQGLTYVGHPEDILTGVKVTESVQDFTDDTDTLWLEPGDVYERAMDFIARGELGLRTLRPLWPAETYDRTTFNSLGVRSSVAIDNTENLLLDIYSGTDLATPFPKVSFNHYAGDLDGPEYLWTDTHYKNIAYVSAVDGTVRAALPGVTLDGPTNLDRRVLYLDSDKEKGADETNAEYDDRLRQWGRRQLRRYNERFIFQTEISPYAEYKYGEHYSLGDKVLLVGQYGVKSTMRIAEYIRTEDAEGDRGYPTLQYG
jgi:hypothetical protein